MMLVRQKLKPALDNCRILHFAPEKALSSYFLDKVGPSNYLAADIAPEDYPFCDVQKFDLCKDLSRLEPESYDLVVHSHVLEHVPCNYAMVLYGLHKALKSDGIQLCCIPFNPSFYQEDCSSIGKEERTRRFGQRDHYRRFGEKDVQNTVGMLFDIPEEYDLEVDFSEEDLDQCNIPASARKGFNGSTILALKKGDPKLS
jgi:predicted SAM-dependent methyltransferase